MQWWYNETDGIFHEAFPNVKLRKCSESDLDGFYEFDTTQQYTVRSKWDTMMCLDNPEDVYIKGQYTSDSGSMLNIDVERCFEKDKQCESVEEIEKFFDNH